MADEVSVTFQENEAICFSSRGWEEFKQFIIDEHLQIGDLMTRMDGDQATPTHSTLSIEGKPLELVWTTDECRQLFVGLAHVSKGATEKACDFWQFVSLVSLGIVEDGIVCY